MALPAPPDSARKLTAEGRQKVAAVVKAAKRGGAEPSLIVSSPYVRAVETARIAAHEFGYAGEIVRIGALVPESDPESAWSELRECGDEAAILVAGHEPLLSWLAAWLLGAPGLRIEMRKATMLRIDLEVTRKPQGTLRWMLTAGLAA